MDNIAGIDLKQEEVTIEEVVAEELETEVYTDVDASVPTHLVMAVDPGQHNYSIPASQHQYGFVVEDNVQQEVVMDSTGVSQNTVTPYISHHDYISTIVMEPRDNVANNTLQPELVIEEAAEHEVITQSTQDIINSKPLTAMYLQAPGPVSRGSIYMTQQSGLDVSPMKYTSASEFVLGNQQNATDISCREILEGGKNGDDSFRLRSPYNSSSYGFTSIGDLQLKVEPEGSQAVENDNRGRLDAERSVGAILAASEAIKHQDIASEVEIGTCQVDASPSKQRGRKRKATEKKRDIDDDIDQIRKAAKNVAYTLKGMSKPEREVRKRRKPRIKLTLTKSKSRRAPVATYHQDDEDEDDDDEDDDNDIVYESKIRTKKKKRNSTDNPEVIYQCEYCDKQFKSCHKVKCHAKTHANDRNFICQECGSAFKRREHLVRHYRRHTGDRPYQCLECGKAYFRLEHLKRHSFYHSGEKPFECSQCDKSFARHDRLIKHSLVHDN